MPPSNEGTATAFKDNRVAHAFADFPSAERKGLLLLRELIFEVAANTNGVGEIQETLKWGQPAYLTPQTKSGSTLRLGLVKGGGFAIFTHCQTTILTDFRQLFPDDFDYQGNRAIHFRSETELPPEKLEILIRQTLTYHLRRRRGNPGAKIPV